MDKSNIDLESIKRGAQDILVEEELKKKLVRSAKLNKPLNVKLGLDPTSPDLHLGHTVVLVKLRQLQDLGHVATLIIGDFTASIGDPSGRNITRPVLEERDITENARTYFDQVSHILDMEKVTIKKNSEWLYNLSAMELVKIASMTTVARMIERDDFSKRYETGKSIALHEFIYPLMQGYDSVVTRADVELGGTDQKFNLLMGRDLQRNFNQEPQCVITMPILEGLDGIEKMSKTKGNHVALSDTPTEMFGKLMSISDDLMWRFIDLLTFRDDREIQDLKRKVSSGFNPKDLKVEFASEIVERFHGKTSACAAVNDFEARFKKNQLPENMNEKTFSGKSFDLIFLLKNTGLVKSTSDGFRSIEQGAVKVDGHKVLERNTKFGAGDYILQVGKRRFIKVLVRD